LCVLDLISLRYWLTVTFMGPFLLATMVMQAFIVYDYLRLCQDKDALARLDQELFVRMAGFSILISVVMT
jgi:hypothetical protein